MNKSLYNDLTPVSERLKEAMYKRDKRQVDICRDLNMNKSTLSGYMSGAHIPDKDVIAKLAKYLRVDPAWLSGFDVSIDGALALSPDEEEILVLFRNADDVSKEAVKRILAYHEGLSKLRKE